MYLLPITGWLPKYQRHFLRGDLVAGVSSWALVVPQSVAYAQIAGVPALILTIVVSLLLVLTRSSRPSISPLGRALDGAVYGTLDGNEGYQPIPGLLSIRQDGLVLFANVRKLRQEVLEAAGRQSPPCAVVLLDLEMRAGLDIESAGTLEDARVQLAGDGIELWLAGVHARVRDMLQRTGFGGEGGGRIFPD